MGSGYQKEVSACLVRRLDLRAEKQSREEMLVSHVVVQGYVAVAWVPNDASAPNRARTTGKMESSLTLPQGSDADCVGSERFAFAFLHGRLDVASSVQDFES